MLFCTLAMTFASCGGGTFTIDGDIKGLGTQNIRIIYVSDNSVKGMWQPVMDNKFTYTGVSDEPAVVEIYSQQKVLLAHILVENGDKIKISGDLKKPYETKVTGTKENEEWSDFINKNKDILTKGNSTLMDIEIEKFIRDNPKDVVSTLLLMYDYSRLNDIAAVEKLLMKIDKGAKPESLLVRFESAKDGVDLQKSPKQLTSFILYSNADSIETFNPSFSKVSLLYFWNTGSPEKAGVISQLKSLRNKYGSSKLQIADITFENDSSVWKHEIKTDSVKWKRFWGLGGQMNNAIKDMGVRSTPLFIVTDSVGGMLYRGKSIEDASAAIATKIK